jgi:hypothetical protein
MTLAAAVPLSDQTDSLMEACPVLDQNLNDAVRRRPSAGATASSMVGHR